MWLEFLSCAICSFCLRVGPCWHPAGLRLSNCRPIDRELERSALNFCKTRRLVRLLLFNLLLFCSGGACCGAAATVSPIWRIHCENIEGIFRFVLLSFHWPIFFSVMLYSNCPQSSKGYAKICSIWNFGVCVSITIKQREVEKRGEPSSTPEWDTEVVSVDHLLGL